MKHDLTAVAWQFALLLCTFPIHAADVPTFRLEIKVDDPQGNPLSCRIHLRNRAGEPQIIPGQPFWNDHFVCDGHVAADFNPGKYFYEIEHGPEFERKSGAIEGTVGKTAELRLVLSRISNLWQAGWYSADLHVHRPLDEIERLIAAEDLDFAPVITWWNNRNLWKDQPIPQQLIRSFDAHRFYGVMAGEDEREGGALMFYRLDQPLALSESKREVPSPMRFVEEARRRNKNVWIDIEKPFWWDVPVWLASGQMNSIGIANNHMCRSRMYLDEAWGKPRDIKRLPNPRGNGFWTQEIYYHILNCGLRIPPSAGSASGVLPNPVGYNRVYVHLDEPLTVDHWFAGLSRGQCFVTNGPLLLVKANDRFPGATFKMGDGKSTSVHLEIQLTSNDRVPRLEVIQNGVVTQTVPCADKVSQQQSIDFTTEGPGWFLVRAFTDVENTFRFASTAPWFVESDGAPRRISRRSAQFFLDWVDERIARVKANVADEAERREVLAWHDKAREFWQERVKLANAE